MARYLVISSQVAHGHVGLSAIVPALQALGHEVIALPTILLSNHPGHAKVAGTRIDPDVLGQMIDALDANGRLDNIDAVLTGYMPTVAHVQFAAETVRRVGRRMANAEGSYFCDPVLGDDPKGLYVAEEVAVAIKKRLLPLSQTIFPNRFELQWLSGLPVTDAASAIIAACSLGWKRMVYATSIPAPDADTLLTVETFVDLDHEISKACRTRRRDHVPHGTGDFLSALLLATGGLGRSVGCVDALIEASVGFDELQLITTIERWRNAPPVAEERIEALR